MSQHLFQDGRFQVLMGYDRPLDYVFCVVDEIGKQEPIYSNLDDENAGCEQQDVDYYRQVLEELGVAVPESMFFEVRQDQEQRIGNRVVNHSQESTAND